jgi:hypothetical protein
MARSHIFFRRVCMSAWNNSAPTEQFSWNLIFEDFSKICGENLSFIKSAKNNRFFTWRPMYIYETISLSSSQNEKCFGQKLYKKSKHTFCVQ